MAYFLRPEMFVTAIQNYFAGWWVLVDGAIFLAIFIGISQAVFEKKFPGAGGKAFTTGLGVALGGSMLLVEAATGFNLFFLSPIVVLILCSALWFYLYHFFTHSWAETGKEGNKIFWLILTAIFPLMLFLGLLSGIASASVSGKAAALGLPPNPTPLGMSVGLINSLLELLIVLGFAMLMAMLLAKAFNIGPGKTTPVDADKIVAAVRDEGEKTRKKVDDATSSLRNDIAGVRADTQYIRNAIDDIRGAIAGILRTLTNFNDFFKKIGDKLVAVSAEVTRIGRVLPEHEGFFTEWRTECTKFSNWVKGTLETIEKASADVQNKVADLVGRFANFEKQQKEILDTLSRYEKSFESLGRRIDDLFKQIETLTDADKGVLAQIKQLYDFTKGEFDIVKTQLKKLDEIKKGITELKKKVSAIDIKKVLAAINASKGDVIARVDTLEQALTELINAKGQPSQIAISVFGNAINAQGSVSGVIGSLLSDIEGLDQTIGPLAQLVQAVMANADALEGGAADVQAALEKLRAGEIEIGDALKHIDQSRKAAKRVGEEEAAVAAGLAQVQKDLLDQKGSLEAAVAIDQKIISTLGNADWIKNTGNPALQKQATEMTAALKAAVQRAIGDAKDVFGRINAMIPTIDDVIAHTSGDEQQQLSAIKQNVQAFIAREGAMADQLNAFSNQIDMYLSGQVMAYIEQTKGNIDSQKLAGAIVQNFAKSIEGLKNIIAELQVEAAAAETGKRAAIGRAKRRKA